MKKIILLSILTLGMLITLSSQSYIPIELSGFNADVVLDAGETLSTSGVLDGAGWAYYSTAKKQEGGIPQSFTSNSRIPYQLASFKANNALQFKRSATRSGTITFGQPIKTSELWILGLGTDGTGRVNVVINYSDGTKSAAREISFADWYQDNPLRTALHGLGRILAWGNEAGKYSDNTNFSLLEQIVPADKEKTITSISLQAASDNNIAVFAVTALDINSENPQNKTLHFISNSHLDTQWNWTVKTVIEEYLPKTLRQNFSLFEKYPDFQFNFEGAIKYMWAKEYYPQEYEKLKQYVNAGRWNIAGGSVDANEVMVVSAESMIRNFLYGQKFYEKEFGRKGGRDIMLPDCFGFPYSLPSIANHCDVTGFHTAKLKWGSAYEYNLLPNIAKWRGVDGSEIYAILKPDAYDNEDPYRKDMSVDGASYSEIIFNEDNYGVPAIFKYVGNKGDIGGSVADVTAQWLEKSVNGDGPIKVLLSTPDEAFADFVQGDATLPVWNDELAMRVHGVGCYTSQTILKYWNRKNELLADATEKSSVVSDWLGTLKYQSEPITNSWIRVLWHQFHDDLPGTAIPEAYYYTYNDQVLAQLDLSKTLVNSVGAVATQLSTAYAEGIPVVVYNPLSITRTDIAEGSIEVDSRPTAISVLDKDRNAVPAQITDYKNGKLSFIFLATVPSLGYATYDIQLNKELRPSSAPVAVTANSLENEHYKIRLNQHGDVSSILDKKQSNKELLSAPIRMAMLYDSVYVWSSWEISYEDITANPREYVDENLAISIAEEGPLRSSLKVTRKKGGSEFVQYIRLTSEGTADRIDFVNEIDWQSRKRLLKAVFPLTASNQKATYDISLGTIQRGNSNSESYEFQGHQWADLTHNDNTYGISILNDCKYGWDKPNDNTLRLSLIHTPFAGLYHHEQHQDLGLNKFTYSVYRHMGTWNENTQWEASKLNQPLMVFQTAKQDGTLGESFEFARVNNNQVAIKALKKAETSDDMIIRLYELTGNNHTGVEVTLPANIVSAKEVNGLEEETGNVSFSGNKITFDITAYQPKTFAVKLADISNPGVEPSSGKVELSYNIDVMSMDSKMNDGQFGKSGYAYPAELIAGELVVDGITFNMGSGMNNGEFNAVRCQGQEIALPQGEDVKKIYLLAASQKQGGSVADFIVDGTTTGIKVEYFADYVGQWNSYFANGYYRPENAALTLTHRHDVKANKNIAYHYLYIFKYAIPVEGNPRTLKLPNDEDVIVFAVTLSDNKNDDIIPLSDIRNLPEFTDIITANAVETCGSILTPVNITASGYVSESESPRMAFDNDPFTKWCDNKSGTKWIEYDFGKEVEICQWNVIHAGRESQGMITSDFRLQYANSNGEYVNADVVTGNKENLTTRTINNIIRTSKVRLTIDKGEQNGNTVRIFSFEVYGDDRVGTGLTETKKETGFSAYNYPNPFSDRTVITCDAPDNTINLTMNVYSITGELVDKVNYPVYAGGKQELNWQNRKCEDGMYFYVLSATASDGTTEHAQGKMMICK